MIGEEKFKNYQLSATKNIEGEKVEITMTPREKIEEFDYKVKEFSANSFEQKYKEESINSNFTKNKKSSEFISERSNKYGGSRSPSNIQKSLASLKSVDRNSIASSQVTQSQGTKKKLNNILLAQKSQKPQIPKIAN